MEMSGSALVPASQQETWEMLNDTEVLKACIPGCESVEKTTDTSYQVAMVAKIGPISAGFKGKMSLSDLNPPSSYSISFDGQGGAAGFAKGSAKVKLAPENDGTRLTYSVSVQVGGRLAQVGSRLIDGVAKKNADEFFSAFLAQFQRTPQSEVEMTSTDKSSGSHKMIWMLILLVIVAIVGSYFALR